MKNNYGGRREGAGRPRKDENIVLSIRINRELAAYIREKAKTDKKSIGDVVAEAIIKSR